MSGTSPPAGRARSRLIFRVWMTLLLALLLGCVPNRMYRLESVEVGTPSSLAFIEFDDQGELWTPTQLSHALEKG